MKHKDCCDMNKWKNQEERKIYMNKYCPHDFETIEKRIQDYKEQLKQTFKIKNKSVGDLIRKSNLRKNYLDEIKWKNKLRDDHCTYCLGNLYHIILSKKDL